MSAAPGVTVRRVRHDEHAALADLIVAAYRAVPGDRIDDEYERELRRVGDRAREAEVLVAVDRGRVLGGVTYVDGPGPWAEIADAGTAEIQMLAVAPDEQRRGVGGALLDACLQRAHAAGRPRVWLLTTPWMEAARRLYLRAGFRRVPERDWWPTPAVELRAYVLDLATPP